MSTALVAILVFAVVELAVVALLARTPKRTFRVHEPGGPKDYWPRGNRR